MDSVTSRSSTDYESQINKRGDWLGFARFITERLRTRSVRAARLESP